MALALLLAGGVALAATSTLSNSSPIQILDDAPANPYPSQINVQNLSGNITDVDLKLSGYSHIFPDDVGVLVVGPQGQKVLVMSDVGFTCDVSGIDLTFDDEATSSLPNGCAISAGTFRPTQGTAQNGEGSPIDANFPAPAPAGPYGAQLSDFDGTDPNGTWSLYVFDDTDVETGQIANGWSLVITTADDDTTAPTVTDTTPDGTVSRTAATVTATFSEEVQNVTSSTFILERNIAVKKTDPPKYVLVDATVEKLNPDDPDDLSWVLNPVEDLPKGDYRATITTDVTDMADNALEDPVVWTFRVKK
jgi:hypothetical protein